MKVGIVGLGLIGGSFAKAYHEHGAEVFGWNRSRRAFDFAMFTGDVDGELTKDNAKDCDLILVCIFPQASIEYIREMAPYFGKKTLVIDCCGTKRTICRACFPIAHEYGFTFIGGHPMAGTQYAGFKFAKEDMYDGAPMVLVPEDLNNTELIAHAKELLSPAGFTTYSVTTAEKHDEMIAFTSQMAHVVSSAYIKSPTAGLHKGFSAGSYKDMTRVAWLNPDMWSDIFIENSDNLVRELDVFIDHVKEYRDAIESHDRETLRQLLQEGREAKGKVDGR